MTAMSGLKILDAADTFPYTGSAPADSHDLSALQVILSTGSPLAPPGFDYIYEHVASQDKQRIYLERCNHEMLLDCESERVVGLVERMLGRVLARELERDAPVAEPAGGADRHPA